jgi:hypothetical protein
LGECLFLGSVLKITEVEEKIIGLLFTSYVLILIKKWLGHILCDFGRSHLVTLNVDDDLDLFLLPQETLLQNVNLM